MKSYSRGSWQLQFHDLGEMGGDTIILLHGFPGGAESWIGVATRLAANGYRVLVPMQRGYSAGYQPELRRNYKISALVEDLRVLMHAAGINQAHIAGHDWGGVIAWSFAFKYPKSVKSLTVVSAPHPKAFFRSLWRSKQAILSRYMLFFQLPAIPELMLSRRGGAPFISYLCATGLTEDMAEKYRRRLIRSKKSLGHALNWYRAIPLELFYLQQIGPVAMPTLFIYGLSDKFLSRNAADLTRKWASGSYQELFLSKGTHWIPEESTSELAKAIDEFVQGENVHPWG